MLTDQAKAEFAFDESPCDTCKSFARCKIEMLACEGFLVFVRLGARRWTAAPRVPSRKLFNEMYPGHVA